MKKQILIGTIITLAIGLCGAFVVTPQPAEAGAKSFGAVSPSKRKARRVHKRPRHRSVRRRGSHTRSLNRQRRKVRRRFQRHFPHVSRAHRNRTRHLGGRQGAHHRVRHQFGVRRGFGNRASRRYQGRINYGNRRPAKYRKQIRDRLGNRHRLGNGSRQLRANNRSNNRGSRNRNARHTFVDRRSGTHHVSPRRGHRLDRRASGQLVANDRPFKLSQSGAYARDARTRHQRRFQANNRGSISRRDGDFAYTPYLLGYSGEGYRGEFETYVRQRDEVDFAGQDFFRNSITISRTGSEVERSDWQWVDLAVGPYDVNTQTFLTCVRGNKVHKELKDAGWTGFSRFFVSARHVQFYSQSEDKKPYKMVIDRCSGKIVRKISQL